MGDRLNKFVVTREFAGFRWGTRGFPWPITATTRGFTVGFLSILAWAYLVLEHDISKTVFRVAWVASIVVGAVAGWAIGRWGRI